MKLKNLLSFLLLTVNYLTINIANAQTVKDWYCPTTNYNKVSFYMPDANTGSPTDATRIMFYTPAGANYKIMDAKLFQGQPTSIQTSTVAFVGNEVKLLSDIVTNSLGATNKKIKYSIPLTIFKLPQKGQTTRWVYKGDNYSAVHSTIIVNGDEYDAIKVTQKVPRWPDSEADSYYVVGYGLIETEILGSNGKIIVTDKFSDRGFDNGSPSN